MIEITPTRPTLNFTNALMHRFKSNVRRLDMIEITPIMHFRLTSFLIPPQRRITFLPLLDFAMLANVAAASPLISFVPPEIIFTRICTAMHRTRTHHDPLWVLCHSTTNAWMTDVLSAEYFIYLVKFQIYVIIIDEGIWERERMPCVTV